jgi:hypothetical protein
LPATATTDSRQGEHRCGYRKGVQHDRKRLRRAGGDEQRRRIAAEHAKRGKRRPVNDGKKEGGESRGSQQHEGGSVSDEAVKRVSRKDRCESGDRAGAAQDGRHVRLGQRRDVERAVAAAQRLAGCEQDGREEESEGDPHARAEQALLDGIAHQENAPSANASPPTSTDQRPPMRPSRLSPGGSDAEAERQAQARAPMGQTPRPEPQVRIRRKPAFRAKLPGLAPQRLRPAQPKQLPWREGVRSACQDGGEARFDRGQSRGQLAGAFLGVPGADQRHGRPDQHPQDGQAGQNSEDRHESAPTPHAGGVAL